MQNFNKKYQYYVIKKKPNGRTVARKRRANVIVICNVGILRNIFATELTKVQSLAVLLWYLTTKKI